MTNPRAHPARQAPAGTPTADRLELMQTFVRIVEAGSLSAAAARLGATQPTVSRRLQALERLLGLRLLQRTTHAMRLTQDGERCFEHARALLDGWSAFETEMRGTDASPEGLLRVVVPHAFGQEQLVAPVTQFLREHPGLSVEWLLRDDFQDFVAAGVDCAIQVGEVRDPSLVAIHLAQVPRIVVAAPALLQGGPVPMHAEELARLPWLALRTYYRGEMLLTHAHTGETCRLALSPRLSTDSLYAMRSAAEAGLGVCVGSAWMMAAALQAGRLVHLAPQWHASALPLYLVYPYARFYPQRLRRFIAAMREAMPAAMAGAVAPAG